jgi:hypothetical protein
LIGWLLLYSGIQDLEVKIFFLLMKPEKKDKQILACNIIMVMHMNYNKSISKSWYWQNLGFKEKPKLIKQQI